MVLLAEYQAPPPVDEIRVGNSLALRPRLPRARRGPTPKSKPFDAGEIYYTDSQLSDITQWRMTALFEGAKRILTWEEGIISDRGDRIERLRGELERRGLDFEKLVRLGLATDIGGHLYSGAMAARVMGDSLDERASPIVRRARSWIPVLGLDSVELDDQGNAFLQIISALGTRPPEIILNWIMAVPLEDIIDLIPPGNSQSNYEGTEDKGSREVWQLYRWLLDRFTTTYLVEWKTSSLKLEWKYQHGLLASPCNNRDMATFSVSENENELARQIAARSVEQDEEGKSEIGPAPAGAFAPFAVSAFVPTAVSLLNAGHRKEAAAVFEASVIANPRDAIAINNWAFCLMSESPDKALELFERAAGIGHHDDLLLAGNRLWCLLRLNRLTTALSVSDAVIASLPGQSRRSAHMWSLKGDVVEYEADLRVYILDLISMVVEHSADEGISERWNPLLKTVREEISQDR